MMTELTPENAGRKPDLFRALFERSIEAILIVDEGQRIAEANEAACARLGARREDLLGLPMAEVVASATDCDTTGPVGASQGRHAWLLRDVTGRSPATEKPAGIEWLPRDSESPSSPVPRPQPYGDLVQLNRRRVLADAVSEDMLSTVTGDYLDLLESSSAIYETNGDYAMGIFSSGWCRFMDSASRNLCDTDDNVQALAGGKWHCHESCWNEASRPSIETGQPVDVACKGGIRLYAVPIRAGDEVLGSINFGYGDPPRSPDRLNELAGLYHVSVAELERQAAAYEPRPSAIVELAKRRLQTTAKLIGEIALRKRTEEELRVSQERLELAIAGARIGTWHWDLTSDSLEWSNRCREIFGIPLGEPMSYERFENALHPDDRTRTREAVARALETQTDYDVEYRSVWPDGSTRWIRAKGRGFYDCNGRAIRMEGIVLDVTDRKTAVMKILQLNEDLEDRVARRTAELEAAVKELEAFSYSISHDLRAPLRSIGGYSGILLDEYAPQLAPEAQRYLQKVGRNARQMGDLIDDLLAFSRLSRQPLTLQHVDPANLVRAALDELHQELDGRRVEIAVGDLPACEADPALLHQVFVNLLSNAVKYTRERNPAAIEAGSCERNGERVYYVKDNGVGFDMQYADKLFGVFQRLHRAEDYEGTGVGLALVQRIVHRHGGRIWAEAEVGRGATFYFTLGEGPRHD